MVKLLVLCLAFAAVFAQDNSTDSNTAPTVPGPEKTKEEKYRAYVGERDYVIPFKTRISEPFKDGQTIHALGTIGPDPKRIDFNFHKGAGEDADLPLHLSIRFTEGIFSGKIVYNIFKDGNWSTDEQRISSPYKANEEFDIRVRISNGKFIVYGNRKELGSFEQRMDLEGIDHVSISGDLIKLRVFHYGGTTFPNPYTAIAKVVPGKRLDISALPNGKRVNVNLYRKNGEYALQVSIRFDESAVVRNAMKDGEWGAEEREGEFKLKKNEIFDLTIINEKFSFQIFLNGKRYAAFGHRGAPDDIETLEIDGNVDVNSVTITKA
uniref:Galectin n=1 Tax=Panagrellus redivivus TaxID=6233 RepID=A0A7E4VL44_PANRE